MKAGMLDSQFAALKRPAPDEGVITVSIDATPGEIVERILRDADLKDQRPVRPEGGQ
ncbi:MAG TPA: hypothetical protein VGJ95_03265 [Pseudonocardiaceae bacterium]|jgi:gluconate kinase